MCSCSREPAVDQIAVDAGLAPTRAEELAHRFAPITGWRKEPPETAYSDFVRTLELAAWVRKGCENAAYIRQNWTAADILRSKRMLALYDKLVPEIEITSGMVDDKIEFRYVWPDIPFSIPFGSFESWEVDISRFAGYTKQLGFRKGRQKNKDGKLVPHGTS